MYVFEACVVCSPFMHYFLFFIVAADWPVAFADQYGNPGPCNTLAGADPASIVFDGVDLNSQYIGQIDAEPYFYCNCAPGYFVSLNDNYTCVGESAF